MKAKEELINGVYIIRLKGQLMGGPDAAVIHDKVLSVIDQGFKSILIDLKDVPWINSTGLGILVSSLTSASNRGAKLKLARLSDRIGSLFITTKVNLLFELFDDEESALASFAANPTEPS